MANRSWEEHARAVQRLSDSYAAIPAGGSAIVEFGVEKPGDLVLVDHAIFRAFNKGALGLMHVTGADNPTVFAAIKGLGVKGE